MICKKVLCEENDKTYRLTDSSISSLGADLGDQDPGLLSDRLGRGQPGLEKRELDLELRCTITLPGEEFKF